MIAEWFMNVGLTIQAWFLGLFGDDPLPAWLDDVAGFIGELFTRVAGLGAWFPFPLFGTVTAAVLVLWLAFWIVKGIRWLWGLTPFSGGS